MNESAYRRWAAFKGIVLLGLMCSMRVDAQEQPSLTVGSKAPALDIEHWVQDGDGKFKPVTEFAEGKIYIVEFWATWCGPCIGSMPHISKLQADHAKDGVQVVSISDEDLGKVEEFLEREVPEQIKSRIEDGSEIKTFRDLTKGYCLTADPDRSAHTAYMEAAGQNGIPCSFIVGKSGAIEWIGHPMAMDKALSAVIDDSWNRDAFAEEFKKEQLRDLEQMRISKLLRGKSPAEFVKIVDEELEKAEDPTMRTNLQRMKFSKLLTSKLDPNALMEVTSTLIKESADNPMAINQISWMVYQAADRKLVTDDQLIVLVLNASTDALKKAKDSPHLLDTVAHLQYVRGNLQEAVEVQKRAVALDKGTTKGILEFLEKLEAELVESGKEKEAQ